MSYIQPIWNIHTITTTTVLPGLLMNYLSPIFTWKSPTLDQYHQKLLPLWSQPLSLRRCFLLLPWHLIVYFSYISAIYSFLACYILIWRKGINALLTLFIPFSIFLPWCLMTCLKHFLNEYVNSSPLFKRILQEKKKKVLWRDILLSEQSFCFVFWF